MPVFIGSLAHLALGTPDVVSLTLPHTIRRTTGGVQWHRSSRLRAQDVVLVDGLPVTDLARTVVDLAKVLDRHGFDAVLDDALAARRVNFAAIEHCADLLGTAGRTGSAMLREVMAERDGGLAMRESELEGRFIRLLQAHDLPAPTLQFHAPRLAKVAGRVDCAWPKHKLVVELNGPKGSPKGHSTPTEVDRDLRRQHAAELAGWRLVTFSWRLVVKDPEHVALIGQHWVSGRK